MATAEARSRGQALSAPGPRLPLSALLSQTLLAHTIEVDNEFERATKEAGDHTGISLLFWPFAIRPLVDGPITLEEMAQRTASSLISVLAPVGAAARSGFVRL